MTTPDPRGRHGALARVLRLYEQRRFALLFYSLLLTLAVAPLLDALGYEGGLIEVLLGVNLLAAARGAAGRGHRAFLLTALFAVALRLVARVGDAGLLVPASDLAWITLATVVAGLTLRVALSGRRVTSEHVYAGLSVYLLLGHFFGLLYWSVERAWPGSFACGGTAPMPGGMALDDAIYFSFVTLATLGYGDIVPVQGVARGFSVFEAVAGQLYVAVLVARLVGSYLSSASAEQGGE